MSIFEISFFGLTLAPTWYGLMYALGFIICYEFVKKYGYLRPGEVDSLLFSIFIGVLFGGRIGYVLLYNLPYYSEHLSEIFAFWKWGMSFHGGAIWVIIAIFFHAWRHNSKVFDVSDPLVTILPIALGLWRIGNLINMELLGYSPYYGPLAIIRDGVSHFPSPLLECFLEGWILLIIMLLWKWYESVKGRRPGYASAIFLIWYGVFRLFAELFRLPDAHIGYLYGSHWITLGMIYTVPMLIGGGIIYLVARNKMRN